MVVLKLGGAQALGGRLTDWLDAVAAHPGRVVLVPGGGPFANLVRETQARIGFDDEAAHDMAMMAMAQFGRALVSLRPGFVLADAEPALRDALARGLAPVWAPERMAREAGLQASWDLTSDSLSAWLAGRLKADRLVLVKHGEAGDAAALAARGTVDPLFPAYLAAAGVPAFLADPQAPGLFAQGLDGSGFPAIGLPQ